MGAKKKNKKGSTKWSPCKWDEYFIVRFRGCRRKYKLNKINIVDYEMDSSRRKASGFN